MFGPYLFCFGPFQMSYVTKLMCHSLKTETLDCDVVVRRNNGLNRRVELIWIWDFFLFTHSLLSLTSGESVHNYAHHTLTPSLLLETLCHVTLGRKWHFNILSSDHVWGAIMAWCMFLWEHVSFSKSHPLIFDSFLSMQTCKCKPFITHTLRQAIISAVTQAELQSDLRSFHDGSISGVSYERAY